MGLSQNRGSPKRCTKKGRPEAGGSRRASTVLLVGADAHIGPPASACKAVRRTAPSPIPAVGRGHQGLTVTGATIPQSRCAASSLSQGSLPSQASGRQRSAMVHPTRRCAGGYKIRPYRPAPGLLVGPMPTSARPASVCKAVRRIAPSPIPAVGAAFMAARNRAMIRTGVRWFPSP